MEKQYFLIRPWNLTLTFVLAKQVLLIVHRLMMVNIASSYVKFLQLMKKLWTEQAVFSNLTLNCDTDLGPSHTLLVHCTPFHDGKYLCQFFIKFLQLMNELWTGQTVLSHSTLNCETEPEPSQMIWCSSLCI